MDFELHYTEEQEAFRQEVRAFLDANIPPDMKDPIDPADLTYEQFKWSRDFRVKLGEKGWLAPLYPKEYGGGGLTVEHAIIIDEEIEERDVPSPLDAGLTLCAPALMVWATEEQKQRFLPSILNGKIRCWQCFTEPLAGTDLASLQLRAEKDGNDYILNGQKIFVGSDYDIDYLYTLGVTRPDQPRHQNIGAFLVPADLPGVTINTMNLIASMAKRHIFYENVRVPATHLIGSETDGWSVTQTTFEIEHGGSGRAVARDPFLEEVIKYCKESKRNGQTLSKDPDIQHSLVDLWITSQVSRLFGMRNYWMRAAKVKWAWEGSQYSLWRKVNYPKIATKVMQALGPYALLKDEKWGPAGGVIENHQRQSLNTHPGGTVEAQKIIMARRIGISKTKEKAAAIV